VLRVNYRGSAGFGLGFREAIRGGMDQMPLEDLLAAIDWVGARYRVNTKSVGILGRGFGGFLALRAVQLRPDRFSCAASIGGAVDIVRWLDEPSWLGHPVEAPDATAETSNLRISPRGKGRGQGQAPSQPLQPATELKPAVRPDLAGEGIRSFLEMSPVSPGSLSPSAHVEATSRPVLIVEDPQDPEPTRSAAKGFSAALAGRHLPADYIEIGGACVDPSPESQTALYSRLVDFFNLHLYDFNVQVGIPRPVD
jgi:pimeloyl-ACP methyl ester carboxylesterase